MRLASETRNAGRAAKRQHRAGRRPGAGCLRPRDRAVAVAAEPHPRDRRLVQHGDRRGRRHPADAAGSGRRRRPAVSAVARRARLLPDRRQSLLQCRRHRRACLWQCARTLPRRRSGAADRRGVRRSAQAEEGQHRLRSEEPVRRRRRHARHHHRRRAEAVSQAQGARGRLCRPVVAGSSAFAVQPGDGPGRGCAHRLRTDRPAALRFHAAPRTGRDPAAGRGLALVCADADLIRPLGGGCAGG